MRRLPYEFVAPYAEKLMIQAITAPDWEVSSCLQQYFIFLMSCGWTDLELDQEMLRRVDAAWEEIIRNMKKVKNIKRFS